MEVRRKPWEAIMLMDQMDDYKINHLEVHCLGYILCEVILLDMPEIWGYF